MYMVIMCHLDDLIGIYVSLPTLPCSKSRMVFSVADQRLVVLLFQTDSSKL